MRSRFSGLLAGVVWGLCSAACVPGADSGPAAGTEVPPLTVYVVTGESAQQSANVVAVRGARPTLYCFVPQAKWSRPSARLLRKLDQEIARIVPEGTLVAIWVTPDPNGARDYLPRAQQSLQYEHTALTVFEGGEQGPAEWGINTDVDLTIVAARGGQVLRSFALSSPNETLAEEILAALQ